MSATPAAASQQPYAFPRHRTAQIAFALLAVYVVYAAAQMDVSWERVRAGLDHAGRFFGRMFPPNFERSELLWKGLAESLQIAVLASALGIVLALPFGLLGARNLMPAWVSWPARLVVVLARSFHPVVVAIVFVKAVGFGALAGILALTVASIGFIGKLFTEAIEEVSLKQVEAIRATGAPFTSVLAFGVLPQVFSRFIGFDPAAGVACSYPGWPCLEGDAAAAAAFRGRTTARRDCPGSRERSVFHSGRRADGKPR